MSEPQPMIEDDERTAREEERIGQLDDREMSQVRGIHGVTGDSQQRQVPGESIDKPEEDLGGDDSVDEVFEQFRTENRVFFDEFGEVIEARRDGEGEERKTQNQADVAHEGQNPHGVGEILANGLYVRR